MLLSKSWNEFEAFFWFAGGKFLVALLRFWPHSTKLRFRVCWKARFVVWFVGGSFGSIHWWYLATGKRGLFFFEFAARLLYMFFLNKLELPTRVQTEGRFWISDLARWYQKKVLVLSKFGTSFWFNTTDRPKLMTGLMGWSWYWLWAVLFDR